MTLQHDVGHAFCRECFEGWQKNVAQANRRSIIVHLVQCPTCRRPNATVGHEVDFRAAPHEDAAVVDDYNQQINAIMSVDTNRTL